MVLTDIAFDPRKIVERVVKTYKAEISFQPKFIYSFSFYIRVIFDCESSSSETNTILCERTERGRVRAG